MFAQWRNGCLEWLGDTRGEISSQWDIETADRSGFFNLLQGHVSTHQSELSVNLWPPHRRIRVSMPEGQWTLAYAADVGDEEIVRYQRLSCERQSLFQDFSVRYRFPKSRFPTASIGGRTYVHKSTNRWYQFPVSEVVLRNGAEQIRVEIIGYEAAGRFAAQMYVRDEPGKHWIVHARLTPSPGQVPWVRWDTRFGRVIDVRGSTASKVIISPIGNLLWYSAERLGGRPNIQAMSLARLYRDDVISLTTRTRLVGLP